MFRIKNNKPKNKIIELNTYPWEINKDEKNAKR